VAQTKLAPKVPKLKIPKSMGACADLLFDMKQERLAAEKYAEALKANETALSNHIIDNLPKGDQGAVGRHHKVVVRTEQIPQVEDWEATYKYIKRTGAFDLLQRRLNTRAVLDRLEDGKAVPGTKMFTAVKLSLTKAD
jgi:hypothetical protein